MGAMAIWSTFSQVVTSNEVRNKYAALKLMGWGRFLQSITFDKIYLLVPWLLS